MSYTVLARKYRPQTFDDLVGQEHVAKTIASAIASNRVAHAFLFTGVRGVGKTTTARLLAKALACETGPTATPCNVCPICIDITNGTDMDVLEIDGASNNSVEDVRRLQETIPYQPTRDRYRIVIVDEVHMLSTGAFNAFLKTLEEPPAHVKFIFATTESHKVPVTIRSRCQRYDFRLIPQNVVAARVRHILALENITADDATVALVAREAAGSMRDALTLLDQIVAWGGTALVGAEVSQHLGIADRRGVHDAARAVLVGDAAGALRIVSQMSTHGHDPLHFAKQLLGYLRDLTVLGVTDGKPGDLLDLVEEELRTATALVGEIDGMEMQRAFVGLSSLVDDMARSSAPHTVLEMGLVRLATRPRLTQVATLLKRLDEVEQRLGGGDGGGPGRSRSGGRDGGGREAPAGRPTGSASASGASMGSTVGGHAHAAPARDAEHHSAPMLRAVPAGAAAFASAAVAQTPAMAQAPAAAAAVDAHITSVAVKAPESAPLRSEPAAATAAEPAKPTASLEGLPAWQRIVSEVRDRKGAYGAILEHGVPVTVTPAKIVLSFPDGSFFGRQAQSPEVQNLIAEVAEKILGRRPEMDVRLDTAPPAGPTVAELETSKREDAQEETRRRAMNHPRVIEALQVFPEAAGNVKVRWDEEPT